MRNLLKLAVFAVCFVLFAGLNDADAQSIVSQQQIQAKMDHNKSADQKKLDALKDNTGVNGTDDNALNAKTAAAMSKAGFLPIPGFVFTGDIATDVANYQAAKAALTPAQIADLQNTPNASGVKKIQDIGIATAPVVKTSTAAGVTPQ
jgi:hypothetical protein